MVKRQKTKKVFGRSWLLCIATLSDTLTYALRYRLFLMTIGKRLKSIMNISQHVCLGSPAGVIYQAGPPTADLCRVKQAALTRLSSSSS